MRVRALVGVALGVGVVIAVHQAGLWLMDGVVERLLSPSGLVDLPVALVALGFLAFRVIALLLLPGAAAAACFLIATQPR